MSIYTSTLRLTVSLFAVSASLSFMPFAFAENRFNTVNPVSAETFIGANWMTSPYHQVLPMALSDGHMLIYTVQTMDGVSKIKGTRSTQDFIREVHATEALRKRSTGGVILGSTKDRAVNLVETPVRVVKSVAGKVGDIDSVGEAILFVPKETIGVAGGLVHGIGEILVTGKRITTGATSTRCNGFNCVEKAGEDVWSGFNSLMGKHKSARELHANFGTDPQTRNKAYRKQINRIAYADSYTGTSVKLGVGSAGIDYLSPAMRGVGYYNNGEFVSGYKDAHRQRNYEKDQMASWGIERSRAEAFYKNDVFTKVERSNFFVSLEAIQNNAMRRRLFEDSFLIQHYTMAKAALSRANYIAAFSNQNAVASYQANAAEVSLIANNGVRVIPVYADYLDVTSEFSQRVLNSRFNAPTEIHVIGKASDRLKRQSRSMGVEVIEVAL